MPQLYAPSVSSKEKEMPNNKFYSENAASLTEQYNSIDFIDCHSGWFEKYKQHMTKHGLKGNALDVGAASGRDASYLNKLGFNVTAVEPVQALLEKGRELTGDSVTWIKDGLPALTTLSQVDINKQYDLILLSAVWMHIQPSVREMSFSRLAEDLSYHGWLVISVRNGAFTDGRVGHNTKVGDMDALASKHGLKMTVLGDNSTDSLGRDGVTWTTYVFSKI